eukprot:5203282-Pyramimonas_sp.AAC.1
MGKPWDTPQGGHSDAPLPSMDTPTIVYPRVGPQISGPFGNPTKPGIGVDTSPVMSHHDHSRAFVIEDIRTACAELRAHGYVRSYHTYRGDDLHWYTVLGCATFGRLPTVVGCNTCRLACEAAWQQGRATLPAHPKYD